VTFEWDEVKNRSNFRKHGVWFEEAQTVWADPHASEFHDPQHSTAEERFLRVGYSSRGRVLLIVFCEKGDAGVIRIISARKATAKERKMHEEGI
jgi:uncharacterized DUF497 family protein